jgi:dipeptidase D
VHKRQGLECGLFYELLGDIDMVSLGPDMWGVHAPGERLSIDSVERTYNILVEVLSKIN